jgi:hypothetical protein
MMNLNEAFAMFGAVAALIGGAWAILKIVVWQHQKHEDERFGLMESSREAFEHHLDERFSVQEKARAQGEETWLGRFNTLEFASTAREREILILRAELPREYVRREDHIRFETSVLGKMDALNSKLDLTNERLKNIKE